MTLNRILKREWVPPPNRTLPIGYIITDTRAHIIHLANGIIGIGPRIHQ